MARRRSEPVSPRIAGARIAGHSGGPISSRRGEVRLPASVAVLVAIALYTALPNHLLVAPRYLIPAVELALLVPLIAINPTHLTRETRWSRIVSLSLVFVIIAANLVSLGILMHDLVSARVHDGTQLLWAALQVWLTNIVAFALAFWELDRGGAVARIQRSREQLAIADFRFPQDEDDDTVVEVAAGASRHADWMPTFVDYLYVSITNSTAFSPTDTMPLSTRAKMLMSVQAIAALVTSVLVIARAVNSLN
jgi:hypothetical protein